MNIHSLQILYPNMVRIGLAYPHFIQQASCNCTAMLMATLCNRPCSWATGPRRSIRKAVTGTNKATDVQIVTETCPWTKTDWPPCWKHTSLSCKANTAKQWAAQSNHSKVATLETCVPLGPLSGSLTYWVRGAHWKWTMIWSITWISWGTPWLSVRTP